jgi:two-component system NtrC family sensor kinase
MTLVTVFGTMLERRTLHEATVRRGRSIVEAMAIPVAGALAADAKPDDGVMDSIEDVIARISERNRDICRYAVVADDRGRVIHSTREDPAGAVFEGVLEGSNLDVESQVVEGLVWEHEDLFQVRTTLVDSGQFLGWIAAGFSLEPIEQQVRRMAGRAALVALLLMLGNSIMTALYVETLIRPILNLNQTMKKAGMGNLTVRAPVRHGDEVAELSDVFNRMMDELEASRERDELQRAQLAHTEKMAAVGTLAAGVAHEVNNPLAGILASIENLRAQPDDPKRSARYLDLIADGLTRIERTVANLLDFSRQHEIRLEPTSINHNLHHVVELVGYQLRAAGVDVKFDLDEADAIVLADHFQMEQLLLNLVLNALDAMPEGGTLYLRTRVRGGKVIAEVRDTGTGILAENRDRIFDPFFTTRDVGEGTGLGLAVSSRIVEAHGGTIELETKIGRGSTFRIILPAMRDYERGEDA